MPLLYQKYRIDPLDLQPNVAIGVALPFNASGVFTSTYSTKDQIKYNLINLLLTQKGERIENPEFGSNIRSYIFEQITPENTEALKASIANSISTYVPEVVINSIEHILNEDQNTVSIKIFYALKLSGNTDNVTISFI
jgi:phage baseplate assembly protein W